MKPSGATLVVGLIVAACSGCGARVERGIVEGMVLRNGQALPNVLVTLLPDAAAGPASVRASGVTDAAGRFRLVAEDQRDEVVVGPYRVIVEDMAVYSAPRSADGMLL